MANSQRSLLQLPGYDTAPDVYETPSLASDVSTLQTSPPSPSPSVSDTSSGGEDENGGYGVSRRRLYPERARRRFSPSRVDARRADLSDRVDGRRRGYGVRRRVEGEEEGWEQRLARLRREVEECRAEAERVKREQEVDEEDEEMGTEGLGDDVEALNRLLGSIEVPIGASKAAANGIERKAAQPAPGLNGDQSDEKTLAQVADFDSRLSELEKALGLASLDAPGESLTSPVLPTLTLLDRQLAALTSATSLTNLDAARSKIRELSKEADNLSRIQGRPGIPVNGTAHSDSEGHAHRLSPDDLSQLNGLCQLLPTLQSLAPTVPALLTRLRSLKTLHANAASTAGELDEVEKRQQDMDKELVAWREGLEKVESAVTGAAEDNGTNGKFVQGWVRDLEGRIEALK